jgi:hypothetical protein
MTRFSRSFGPCGTTRELQFCFVPQSSLLYSLSLSLYNSFLLSGSFFLFLLLYFPTLFVLLTKSFFVSNMLLLQYNNLFLERSPTLENSLLTALFPSVCPHCQRSSHRTDFREV